MSLRTWAADGGSSSPPYAFGDDASAAGLRQPLPSDRLGEHQRESGVDLAHGGRLQRPTDLPAVLLEAAVEGVEVDGLHLRERARRQWRGVDVALEAPGQLPRRVGTQAGLRMLGPRLARLTQRPIGRAGALAAQVARELSERALGFGAILRSHRLRVLTSPTGDRIARPVDRQSPLARGPLGHRADAPCPRPLRNRRSRDQNVTSRPIGSASGSPNGHPPGISSGGVLA